MKLESKLRTTPACLVIACCLVAVTHAAAGEPSPADAGRIDFERHVAPLLSRYGCNAGACHGASEGQGGLKLSLFGSDVNADYAAVADEGSGRVDPDDPELSLLLEKPTLRTDHGGGRHFADDSIAWRTMLQWIKEGAHHKPGSGILRDLECVPASKVLHVDSSEVRLKLFVTFADGTREDVTEFCEFRAQDETVARVERSTVKRVGPGDTHIIAVYRGQPASAAVLSPYPGGSPGLPECSSRNEIDRLVLDKLRALNIEPSPLASDVDFLRRVSLATIGQLPTPDEIRRFVADSRSDKRSRTIDRLLSHPLHASLWANRMCEITGSGDLGTAAARGSDSLREWKWHEWFRQRFAANVPYDQITRDVLCATTLDGLAVSEVVDQAIEAKKLGDDIHALSSHYAERKTLDLFWHRPKVNEEIDVDELAERISAAFLGVRIECARCHDHPFDRWTQDDHRSLANVFTQVRLGKSPVFRSAMVDMLEQQREARIKGLPTKIIPAVQEVFLTATPVDRTATSTRTKLSPRPLGGPAIAATGDRRKPFADWLTAADNPMFAHNFVNRLWQWYFSKGLVEPVDAFSSANPPSHPELLDTLANEFVRGRYDVRRLERMILTSRTWQQTSIPTPTNASDGRNFARAYVVPLRAETLVDALQSATGSSFGLVAPARRELAAVSIPVGTTGNPELDVWFKVFQRPQRKLTCDCEQKFSATLRQPMLLLSDPKLLTRIREGSLAELLTRDIADEELIEELFLRSLSRWPDEKELRAAMTALQSNEDRLDASADILWSLINTREFVTNH